MKKENSLQSFCERQDRMYMEAIRDTYPDEYQFFQRYGVKSILAAPFSKRINQGYIAVDDPTHFQDDPTFLFIISYAVVVELNEIKLSQSIAAAQRASKYSDRDVYVNCLGDLEIRNAKGTLTEEDIFSDLCLNLFIGRVPIGVSDVPNGTFHSEYRFLKIESQRKLTVP